MVLKWKVSYKTAIRWIWLYEAFGHLAMFLLVVPVVALATWYMLQIGMIRGTAETIMNFCGMTYTLCCLLCYAMERISIGIYMRMLREEDTP